MKETKIKDVIAQAEKDFDDRAQYYIIPEEIIEDIKEFIFRSYTKDLLQSVVEIAEGMRLPEKSGTYGEFDHLHIQHNIGYNSALSDIINNIHSATEIINKAIQ